MPLPVFPLSVLSCTFTIHSPARSAFETLAFSESLTASWLNLAHVEPENFEKKYLYPKICCVRALVQICSISSEMGDLKREKKPRLILVQMQYSTVKPSNNEVASNMKIPLLYVFVIGTYFLCCDIGEMHIKFASLNPIIL